MIILILRILTTLCVVYSFAIFDHLTPWIIFDIVDLKLHDSSSNNRRDSTRRTAGPWETSISAKTVHTCVVDMVDVQTLDACKCC